MNIYTYYEPLANHDPEHEGRLLLLWKNNWHQWGYNPIVLNEWTARQSKKFPELEKKAASLPTVNRQDYERACYYRHLAMAHIGGGLLCDYDLFCHGAFDFPIQPPNTLITYQNHIPSLIYGGVKAYREIVRGILQYEPTIEDTREMGKPHVSDMHIFLRGDIKRENNPVVKNYGEDGWQSAPFVHYSTASMAAANKLPKWRHIPTMR